MLFKKCIIITMKIRIFIRQCLNAYVSCTLFLEDFQIKTQMFYVSITYFIRQHVPRWQSGHAVACRATTLRFKSGPWLAYRCVNSCERRKSLCFLIITYNTSASAVFCRKYCTVGFFSHLRI